MYNMYVTVLHLHLLLLMQLGRIYLDMVNVYKVLSENISSAVSVSGEPTYRSPSSFFGAAQIHCDYLSPPMYKRVVHVCTV